MSQQPLLHLLFPFYKHIHMWESTSHDVCLNLNSLSAPAASAWSRNCSSRAAGPCCQRAGTHWTEGRAPNWPEWLQSEPIRDKRWIALQICSDSIVLFDQTTIVLLTKQRTGVQVLLPLRWPSQQPWANTFCHGRPHTPWANTPNAWITLHYMLLYLKEKIHLCVTGLFPCSS